MHREAITFVKYLPNSKVFVSFCSENYIKVWKPNFATKKAQIIVELKVKTKVFQSIMLMQAIEESDTDRFLVIFKSGDTEIFEFNGKKEELYLLETEKSCEHDSQLTGFDYSPQLKIFVTSDGKGVLRVWNKDKKFLREINFPTAIDSVCFLNSRGDLIVSHAKRVSTIKFETYWTKTFDYFGVTTSKYDE